MSPNIFPLDYGQTFTFVADSNTTTTMPATDDTDWASLFGEDDSPDQDNGADSSAITAEVEDELVAPLDNVSELIQTTA